VTIQSVEQTLLSARIECPHQKNYAMNPIIRRELLELMRTRKAVALQLGLATACMVMVLLRWPSGEIADLSGSRSLQVLRVFGYGLLAGILLLAPAYPATTIVREKIKGTLALLLNSPMPPWSIYVGKLGGVLGFTAVLLVVTLPAAAACHALGGTVVRGGIGALYLVLIVATIQLATLGLLVSSAAQSTDGALRVTYGLVLAIAVVPLAPFAITRGDHGLWPAVAEWFRCLSPIPAVMEIMGQGDVGAQGFSVSGNVWPRYMLLAGISSVVCAVLTIRRLNQTILDRARAAGVMTEDRTDSEKLVRGIFFVIDPQKRSRAVSHWINPVMVKEFRTRRFGRSSWMIRLIAIGVILSLLLSVLAAIQAVGWGMELIGGALVLLQIALLILFAPSLGAGLVSSERESGSWQLLRMTPISAGAVLRGKLLSVIVPLILILCATLPGYAVMMLTRPDMAYRVGQVSICLILTAAFAILVSAAASTLFRSTATSMIVSFIVLLTICMGPLLFWLGREAPWGHSTVQAALSIDPVAAALQAAHTPGFTQYELLPLNWWIIGSACVALIVFICVRTWQLCRPD
jgi:ABC-type transport system involved in multi-copper enzyme maturation permease subunit